MQECENKNIGLGFPCLYTCVRERSHNKPTMVKSTYTLCYYLHVCSEILQMALLAVFPLTLTKFVFTVTKKPWSHE